MNFDEMDVERLRHFTKGLWKEYKEVEQILGKALGYPQFMDDQKNFPNSTEADGVCIGDNVAVTLAQQAAARIAKLSKRPVTKEEAIAQYHFLKKNSKNNYKRRL
jgi:hypothetical protein